MLVDEHVRQGYTLLEAFEQTEHLRARDRDAEESAPRQRARAEDAPPDMAALGALEQWNQLRR